MRANVGSAEKPEDIAGKPQPPAGKYHTVIKRCNDSRVKKDGSAFHVTIFELQILAGTTPGQEGKEMAMFVRLGENGEETDEYCGIISRLGLATGVLKPRSGEVELNADMFEGQQFIVGWESYFDKNKKEKFSVGNFGLDTWSVFDEAVRDVPKNAPAIKLWQEALGNPNAQPPQPEGEGDTADLL